MLKLAQEDLKRWLVALQTQPTQTHELLPWIEGALHDFFPFKRIFNAHSELIAGQIKTTHWLASGHDDLYLHQLSTTFDLEHRGSMQWWFQSREPFTIDPNNPPLFTSDFELAEIKKFEMQTVAVHGVLNSRSSGGTYFSFAEVPTPLSGWHIEASRLLAPVQNVLFLSYIAKQSSDSSQMLRGLTHRQKDIVRHVAEGKDDKSVKRTLGISEKTVRNQLSDIYSLLGISKRTQLLPLLG